MAFDSNQTPPAPNAYDGSNPAQPTAHMARPAQGGSGSTDPKGDKPKHHMGNTAKAVIGGVAGGAVVSAALVGCLMGTGVIKTSSSTGSSSGSAQTITINSDDDDTSLATAVAAKVLPSVVTVNVSSASESGLGSGVILDTDGDIITNYHVVEGATTITVTMNDQTYNATLVGSDESSDIAVIKAEFGDTQVTPIEVGDSSALEVGDWVMTAGSPLGLEQSVSTGIVSALYRNTLTTSSSGSTIYTNLIQTDAAINQGNSGGALVNSKGQLVGINTLLASETESFSGIGLAIPGNYAVEIANKIIAGEPITHAYLGVSSQTVTSSLAQRYHLSTDSGAYIAAVSSGQPADQAGIQAGDIITKLGDTNITSADNLTLAVRSHSVGDTVDITYVRDGQTNTVSVTLGSDEELQKEESQSQSNSGSSSNGSSDGYGYGFSYPGLGDLFGNGSGSGSGGYGSGSGSYGGLSYQENGASDSADAANSTSSSYGYMA